jgi:hypothetical protein
MSKKPKLIIMKKFYFLIIVLFFISSCKSTFYKLDYSQVNQTQVVLSGANYNVLGSFTGSATEKKMKMTIRNMEGLLATAKANLLAKARSAGVEMEGSRALVNVTSDIIENNKMVTVTISAEIIEFTK